jgi:hypothetical protein
MWSKSDHLIAVRRSPKRGWYSSPMVERAGRWANPAFEAPALGYLVRAYAARQGEPRELVVAALAALDLLDQQHLVDLQAVCQLVQEYGLR